VPSAALSDADKQHIARLLRDHGVVRAAIFGSFARGTPRPQSDLDLLVELLAGSTLLDLVELRLDLMDALGREVDVVTYAALNPGFRERVLREQEVLL
jgi:predicted nucleotidyltransferase